MCISYVYRYSWKNAKIFSPLSAYLLVSLLNIIIYNNNRKLKQMNQSTLIMSLGQGTIR